MNRTYTREWYKKKVDRIKEIIPECALSTDIITGFCTETEEDHQDTLEMMDYVKYDYAYMFAYSERPGTLAARRFDDDVPQEVKSRRLNEVIALHREHCQLKMNQEVGRNYTVLVEGPSKKNPDEYAGRIDNNKFVVFPKGNTQKGDYVDVEIISNTSGTLFGKIIDKQS
jgi:tRNA-2-methylthio-N6-dimethylallyladenosine synthase